MRRYTIFAIAIGCLGVGCTSESGTTTGSADARASSMDAISDAGVDVVQTDARDPGKRPSDDTSSTDTLGELDDAANEAVSDVETDGRALDTTLDARPNEIAKGVYPVANPRFDHPPGNLVALESIVGTTRMVSLGETIHFSDGYARARARVIKYLIAEMGFRAIAFEGDWYGSRKTDDYLVDGEGSIQDALDGLGFSVWMNQSTEKLLKWGRNWNRRHPDETVRIFGFDIQNGPGNGHAIRKMASRLESNRLSRLASDLDACPLARFDSKREAFNNEEARAFIRGKKPFPEKRFRTCKRTLEALERWRSTHRRKIAERFGERRVPHLRAAIRSLKAYNGQSYYRTRDRIKSSESRDAGMADVFDMLRPLYASGERIALFAHNAHNRRRATELAGRGVFKSYGSWLADRHGDDYMPIGFFAYEVQWDWPGVSSGTWTPVRRDAIEHVLHAFGEEALLVDLHEATGKERTFEPGRNYYMGHHSPVRGVPKNHYDGLFYLRKSEPR